MNRTIPALLTILIVLLSVCTKATTITVTVGSGGNFFTPAMFTINPGDTVKWKWAVGFHNTSNVTRPAGAPTWSAPISSIDTQFIYVPTVSGLYTYTCTYHSGMDGKFFVTGCSYPAKPIIACTNGSAACTGDTIHLSIPSQTGVTYQWINGVTTVTGATSSMLNVTSPGAYKVLVNRCGVDSISNPFTVTFHALPAPSFSYTNAGLSYSFTNTTPSPSSYSFLWHFSDGSPNQSSVNAAHTFLVPGPHTVTLKATDLVTQCTDSFSAILQMSMGLGSDAKELYTIYPNPTSDAINILVSAHRTPPYLLSLTGKNIGYAVQQSDKTYYIDVSIIPAAVYILNIPTATGIIREKIVVQH